MRYTARTRFHETTASRHLAAPQEAAWEFVPGQAVMTREGLAGVVTAVESGPMPGYETYIVSLDHGFGGGEYGSSELKNIAGAREAAEATIDGHLASEDYPELAETLVENPPLRSEARRGRR